MTVSLALRDSPRISDATKKRVRAALSGHELRAEPACARVRDGPIQPDRRHRPQQLRPLLRRGDPRHRGRRERRAVPRAALQRILPDGDLHGARARHAAPAHEGHRRGAAVHAEKPRLPAFWKDLIHSDFEVVLINRQLDPPSSTRWRPTTWRGRDAGAGAGRARAPPRGLHFGHPGSLPFRQRLGLPALCAGLRLRRGRRLFERGTDLRRRIRGVPAVWKANRRKPTAIVASNDTSAMGVLRYSTSWASACRARCRWRVSTARRSPTSCTAA